MWGPCMFSSPQPMCLLFRFELPFQLSIALLAALLSQLVGLPISMQKSGQCSIHIYLNVTLCWACLKTSQALLYSQRLGTSLIHSWHALSQQLHLAIREETRQTFWEELWSLLQHEGWSQSCNYVLTVLAFLQLPLSELMPLQFASVYVPSGAHTVMMHCTHTQTV